MRPHERVAPHSASSVRAAAHDEGRYPHLFSPSAVGRLTVPNRIVFAATSSELADAQGMVTDSMIDYYVERARGGAGLIVVEATYVETAGKRLRHNAMVDSDECIPGLRALARAIQAEGCRVALQLNHGGRESVPEVSGTVVAPSAVPSGFTGVGRAVVPLELTLTEIRRIITAFADAARRTAEAGFDAVELHGAHGYLISQFLSPDANRRRDEYGGDPARRARFYVDVLRACKVAAGADFPIICRINGRDAVENGLELQDSVATAALLRAAGADAISVTGGVHASRPYGIAPGMSVERGNYLPYADEFTAALDLPIMVVGRIKTAQMADDVIAAGRAEFVCMSRALIADPHLPRKSRAGEEHLIVPCIACNECLANVHRHGGIVCTMNPMASREREFHEILATPVVRGRVVVVGGGVAGMAAAITAARRGHEVVLFERSAEVGGQLRIAHVPPHREELADGLDYFLRELRRLEVDIRINSSPTREEILALEPTQVVLAVGARSRRSGIVGADLPHVVEGWEVLAGQADTGQVCVIVGGGLVGVEVADFLSARGRLVVLVARSEVLTKAVHADRVYYLDRIAAFGIEVLPHTIVQAITERSVTVRTAGRIPRTLDGIDTVVLCAGYEPRSEEASALVIDEVPTVWIGDVLGSRKLFEAVEEGTRTAMAF